MKPPKFPWVAEELRVGSVIPAWGTSWSWNGMP